MAALHLAALHLAALLLAAAPGLAQPVVAPRLAALRPGQAETFRIVDLYTGGGTPRWSIQADDGGPAGTLDPFSGRYTAPATDTIRTVRVVATRADGVGAAARCQVTVQ